MKLGKRRLLLGGALAATVVATVLAPDPDQAVVAAAGPAAAPASPSTSGVATQVRDARTPEEILGIRPRHKGDAPSAFQPRQWAKPASKPRVIRPVAKVQPADAKAPPLPFKVLGQYVDGDEPAVFLQFNEKTLVVKSGESVDENYRIESIAQGKITFLYVPLAEKQTLALGDVK